jgi:hypothetical protein
MTAMILAALATTFNATAVNYEQNHAIYKTNNDCRQALTKMTHQLRTASAVDPDGDNSECAFISAAGENIRYHYSGSLDKLYVQTDSGDWVLADNITAASFVKETGVDDHGVTYVKNVQILLTAVSDGVSTTMPAAVVIRRNLN